MTRKLLSLLLLTFLVSGCSNHAENQGVTRSEAPINACYVAPPVGNLVGLGVDSQPRNWGSDGHALKPAIDMLVNDLGADFFRVEVFNGETDYESPANDDGDPATFNWVAYDPIFQSKRFTDLFNYVRYINQIASTSHVMLAWHGGLPGWFGGSTYNGDGRSYSLPQAQEDEWVETLLAVMVYARTRAPEPRPQFDLVSPFNEPEFSPPEGFSFGTTNPQIQEARVVRKLVDRMNAIPELAGIYLVVGDHANVEGMVNDRPTLLADSVISARLAATSFHRYSDATATDWVGASPPVFLSEMNSTWAADCYATTWAMGMQVAGNLISALLGGVTAGLAWSDTDAFHDHQGTWQSFGLLATVSSGQSGSQLCGMSAPTDAQIDAFTYTPKPTYVALRHAFHWIRPNASKLPVTDSSSSVDLTAWKNADNTVAVFGRNTGSTANVTVTLTMSNPPSYLTQRVSVSGSYDQVGSPVAITSGSGVFALPSQSVFTLLSSPGDGSGGAGGSGGMGAGGAASGAGGQSAGMSGTAGANGGAPSGGQSGASGADQGGMSGAGGASAGAGGQSGGGQGGASAGASGASGSSSGGAGAGSGGAGAGGQGGAAGSGPTLIAGWAFNEGSGTTTADASGNGHTGTVNGATWTTTGCKYGNCLSFTGTGHNVTTPDANDLDLGTSFTIMAWVKPTTTSGWHPVMMKANGTNLEAFLLYSDPVTQGAYFTDSGNAEKSVTGGSHVSTSAWSNVAMVRNGTTLSYFVNGVSVATATVSALPVVSSSGTLMIGGHSFWSGEWFSGLMDDPRIYSQAMTAAQIQAAMGAGL